MSGASFEVKTGSICALIGPNGAGKTTLFNVISGFYRADRGRIALDGVSILGRPRTAIAKRGLVRTFQLTKVFGGMSVLTTCCRAPPAGRGIPDSSSASAPLDGVKGKSEPGRSSCSRRSASRRTRTRTRTPSLEVSATARVRPSADD